MLLNVAGPSLAERAIDSDGFGDDLLESVGLYGNSIGMLNSVEMLPRAENRITLDESTTDDHGNPVPDVQVDAGEFSRNGAEKNSRGGNEPDRRTRWQRGVRPGVDNRSRRVH